jgi:hypothetical protein
MRGSSDRVGTRPKHTEKSFARMVGELLHDRIAVDVFVELVGLGPKPRPADLMACLGARRGEPR